MDSQTTHMIGTMLLDTFIHPPKIGIVIRKHYWNNCVDSEHDDWDVEWSNGKITYMTPGHMRIFIKNYEDYKKNMR